MPVFSAKSFRNHEQVLFHQDPDSSLVAIIAIHDTTLGPALGGCGYWSYNIEDATLGDVLRLSRGMAYKAALAGLSFGGGEAVILAPKLWRKKPRAVPGLWPFCSQPGRPLHHCGGCRHVARRYGGRSRHYAVCGRCRQWRCG